MPRRAPTIKPPSDELTRFYGFAGQVPYDIYNGKTLDVREVGKRERPGTLEEQFAQARAWAGENWFVSTTLALKADLLNYRPQIQCAEPAQMKKDKLRRWLEAPTGPHGETRAMQVWDYVRGAVAEWLLLDNLVSFWRDAGQYPYPLRPETVKYQDRFGLDKLCVRNTEGRTERDLLAAGLSPAEAKRYSRPEVELQPELGEHWLVARRGARGYGLVAPRLGTVFRALSQAESMEVGESMYAYAGRLVLRFHKLGFEVRNAANAMRQADFLWKKARATAIETFFKGHPAGFVETTGQFDHKVEYVWTDPKLYENKKWMTITDRLLCWAGPLGFLLMGKTTNLNLLQLLRVEVEADRAVLKPHLEAVLNQAFNAPAQMKLRWDSRCFTDPRLAWDMVKVLAAQGPLSPQTALGEASFDPEEEAQLKVAAATDAQSAEKYAPLYDAAHGNSPAGGERRGPKPGLKQRQEVVT